MNQILIFLLLAAAASAEVTCPADQVITIAHGNECSQYYLCIYGQSLLLTCPTGLGFDDNRGVCDHLSVVKCSTRSEKPSCPPGVQILIPHETYCSKFYSCDNGFRVEMDCANGTEFYPELQECDWPHSDGCWSQSTSVEPPTTTPSTTTARTTTAEAPTTTPRTTTTEAPTTTARPTTTPTTTRPPTTEAPTTTRPPTTVAPTTTRPPTTEAPTTTARPLTTPTTTRPPTTEVPTTTRPPTTVAPTTTRPPTTVAPTTTTTARPTTTGAPTQAPTTNIPITSSQIPETTTSQPNICPNSAGISLVPHPTNCSLFYVCVGDQANIYECDVGFEFSPSVNDCVPISEYGCSYNQTVTTTTAPDANICPNSAGISLVPHPTNCSLFYVCVGDQANVYECDAGHEFSPIVNDCVKISGNGCTANQIPTTTSVPELSVCSSATSGTTITLEPHESNCTLFWVCDPEGADPMLLACNPGLEFDPVSGYCKVIAPGGCLDKQNSSIDKQTEICANNLGINLFPDKNDCTIFHICSNADLTTLSCDSGFEFDKENLVCVPTTTGSCISDKKLEKSPVFNIRKLLRNFFGRMM